MEARMKLQVLFLVLTILFISCEEVIFSPKPRGYPRVIYPEKAYRDFTEEYCDFKFEYPAYSIIQQDETYFDESPAHPCWFDIYIPSFDSRIYCSYIPIEDKSHAEKLKLDAFKMADWHLKKATYKEEIPFRKANNVKGMLFEVEGPVASHLQFYLTDSLEQNHFMRGALYFNTQARPDSLAPIYDFVKKDIEWLLETFEWTN